MTDRRRSTVFSLWRHRWAPLLAGQSLAMAVAVALSVALGLCDRSPGGASSAANQDRVRPQNPVTTPIATPAFKKANQVLSSRYKSHPIAGAHTGQRADEPGKLTADSPVADKRKTLRNEASSARSTVAPPTVNVNSAPDSDFGCTLSTLVSRDGVRPSRDQGTESVVLPIDLDWVALTAHGLTIPPADRPAGATADTAEAPLPTPEPSDGEREPPLHEDARPVPPVDVDLIQPEVAGGERLEPEEAEKAPLPPDLVLPQDQRCGTDLVRSELEVVDPSSVSTPQDAPTEPIQPTRVTERAFELSDNRRESAAPVGQRPARPAVARPTVTTGPAAPAQPPAPPPPAKGPCEDRSGAVQLAAAAAAPGSYQLQLSRARRAEMQAISRLADARTKRGFDLAGRNALFSARAEFIQALGMIAQALDALEHHTAHVQAMNDGLQALEESDDFVGESSQLTTNFDAVIAARPHATSVLKGKDSGSVSAMQALQMYYTYAQDRLVFAAGHEPAGSMALHGLGKVYAALSKTNTRFSIAAEPKAIVFYQAALVADGRNFLAANELGVLLANYGKYQQAKAALVQCIRVSGQPVSWRNLAVVHSYLGEAQLARLAMHEAELAARRGTDKQPGPLGLGVKPYDVQWVDVATFARTTEPAVLSDPAQAQRAPRGPNIATQSSVPIRR
jgi:tetratricopeptide (TPR) repeat protein